MIVMKLLKIYLSLRYLRVLGNSMFKGWFTTCVRACRRWWDRRASWGHGLSDVSYRQGRAGEDGRYIISTLTLASATDSGHLIWQRVGRCARWFPKTRVLSWRFLSGGFPFEILLWPTTVFLGWWFWPQARPSRRRSCGRLASAWPTHQGTDGCACKTAKAPKNSTFVPACLESSNLRF